jgi:hypothetical protein
VDLFLCGDNTAHSGGDALDLLPGNALAGGFFSYWFTAADEFGDR